MRRLLVVGAVVLAGLGLGPGASAAAPDATGWWASHRITPPSSGLPTDGQVQSPATVPAGGLYVAGGHTTTDEDELPDPNGAQQPNAPAVDDPPPQYHGISAVRLTLPDNAAAGDLVLVYHRENGVDQTEGLVAIQACPATIVWTPDEGGPITSAPPWDCSTGLAFGAVVGNTVRIPVGGLVRNDMLNIVVMPQPGSAFRAVFAKPDSNTVEVTAYDGPDGGDEEGEAGGGFCATCLPPTVPPASTPIGDPIGELLVTPPASSETAAPVTAPAAQSRRIANDFEPGGALDEALGLEGWKKTLAGAVLGALAVLYLWLMRLPQRQPRLLGLAGAAGREPVTVVDVPRGIGRFARPRTGPPPTL